MGAKPIRAFLSLTQLFDYCAGKELKHEREGCFFDSTAFPLDDCDKRFAFDVLSLSYVVIARMALQDKVARLQYAVEDDRVYASLIDGRAIEIPFRDYTDFGSSFELGLILDAGKRYGRIDKIRVRRLFQTMSYKHYGRKDYKKSVFSPPHAGESGGKQEEDEWWNTFKKAYQAVWGNNAPCGIHTRHHERLNKNGKIAEDLFNLGLCVVDKKGMKDVSYLSCKMADGVFQIYAVNTDGHKSILDDGLLFGDNDKERKLEIEDLSPNRKTEIGQIISTLETESKKHFSGEKSIFESGTPHDREADMDDLFKVLHEIIK